MAYSAPLAPDTNDTRQDDGVIVVDNNNSNNNNKENDLTVIKRRRPEQKYDEKSAEEFAPPTTECCFNSLNDSLTICLRRSKRNLFRKLHSSEFSVVSSSFDVNELDKHKVSFNDTINIRLYETVLSDNPCPKFGPPVGIGWNFISLDKKINDIITNDDGSNEDNSNIDEQQQQRNNSFDWHLSQEKRLERLREFGYTDVEMLKVVNANKTIQRSREKSATRKYVVTAKSKPSNISSRRGRSLFGNRRRPSMQNRTKATSDLTNMSSNRTNSATAGGGGGGITSSSMTMTVTGNTNSDTDTSNSPSTAISPSSLFLNNIWNKGRTQRRHRRNQIF